MIERRFHSEFVDLTMLRLLHYVTYFQFYVLSRPSTSTRPPTPKLTRGCFITILALLHQ